MDMSLKDALKHCRFLRSQVSSVTVASSVVGAVQLSCLYIVQGSKNISIEMLKDVGMTVPKSREQVQYICSKTGDEGMQQ